MYIHISRVYQETESNFHKYEDIICVPTKALLREFNLEIFFYSYSKMKGEGIAWDMVIDMWIYLQLFIITPLRHFQSEIPWLFNLW